MLLFKDSFPILISFIIFLTINLYSIIFIYKNRETYITDFIAFLSISLPLLVGIITAFFFTISISFFITESINILLWKISLLMYFFSLFYIAILYSILRDRENLPIYCFFIFSTFLGILSGIILITDSIWIVFRGDLFIYDYSIPLKIVIFSYQIFFVGYLLYISSDIRKISSPKRFGEKLYLYTLIMILPIMIFLYTLLLPLYFLVSSFIITFWGGFSFGVIYIVLNPRSILILTNNVYYLNIYHKSGVQLYSYEFENPKKDIGSSIWGKILIGINHILSEFIDKKDQIDVLQTKSSEIIVDYDNEYGYAVLVIANKKSALLKKLMDDFLSDFREKYKDELNEISDINRIINVSEFEDTNEIIAKHFKIFL
jgi:hypothetical protein